MKSIVITGSSRGIGQASAKLFAEKGWRVAGTMRKPENEWELNQTEDYNEMIAKFQAVVGQEIRGEARLSKLLPAFTKRLPMAKPNSATCLAKTLNRCMGCGNRSAMMRLLPA